MFLNILDQKEKEKFLELAYYVANYNNDFAEEQKLLINEYRKEMLLTEEEYKIVGKEPEGILDNFTNIDGTKKKAIFIEIMSLLLSDKKFDSLEQEIANIVKNKLDLSDRFYDQSIKWVYDMQDLYNTAEELVYG